MILCEKDDLAEGCSSRSGKLVHGGLRYLEYYEFRLVREALIEREVLLNAASHIIWPMRFVLPHSPEDRPAWLVRLGLFLYDHLGGRKKLPGTRALDLRRDPEGAPILDKYTRGLRVFRLLGRRRAAGGAERGRREGEGRRGADAHALHQRAARGRRLDGAAPRRADRAGADGAGEGRSSTPPGRG